MASFDVFHNPEVLERPHDVLTALDTLFGSC
jgi:hypothetical protein